MLENGNNVSFIFTIHNTFKTKCQYFLIFMHKNAIIATHLPPVCYTTHFRHGHIHHYG